MRSLLIGIAVFFAAIGTLALVHLLVVVALTVTSLISLVPGSWAARARPAALLKAE